MVDRLLEGRYKPIQEQVLQYLKKINKYSTKNRISWKTNLNPAQVGRALRQLKKSGIVGKHVVGSPFHPRTYAVYWGIK